MDGVRVIGFTSCQTSSHQTWILRDARTLISNPAHWTDRVLARDRTGYSVSPSSCEAVRFCAMGATMRVAELKVHQAAAVGYLEKFTAAVGYLEKFTAHDGSIAYVNDQFGHTAVLRVFDRAIADLTTQIQRESVRQVTRDEELVAV